jgi:hypothetical protein
MHQPHLSSQQQMSHHQHLPQESPTAYGNAPVHAPLDYRASQHSQHPSPSSHRKRSRPHEDLQLDLQGLQTLSGGDVDSAATDVPVELTHGPHAHSQGLLQYHRPPSSSQTPIHPPPPPGGGLAQLQMSPSESHLHHHRLPNQPPPGKSRRYGETSPLSHHTTSHPHGPPSVVGQEGMPPPARRPRGPKLKFTAEDDGLLVDLKENKNLTWKQIADFFPGRSSGTLQVRYCTKLKAKTTVWTDETVRLGIFLLAPLQAAQEAVEVRLLSDCFMTLSLDAATVSVSGGLS